MNKSIKEISGQLVMGIDLGSSSCKAVLIDQACHIHAQAEYAYPTSTPRAGWAEQNPRDWIKAVHQVSRQIIALFPAARSEVRAIGLTSAAHIGVLLDERFNILRPAILWNDQRSSLQAEQLNDQHGQLILRQTCQAASSSWTLSHLAWVKEHEPDIWSKVKLILPSKDYLAWYLAGTTHTDPATAVSLQLFDVSSQTWSNQLCGLLQLTPINLPTVKPANQIIGSLSDSAAQAMGLPNGIPIVNGTLDSATELYAGRCTQPGQAMIRLATAGGLQVVVDKAVPHTQRITYPHLVSPYWYVQAGTNTCAAAVQWGLERFCPNLSHQQAQELAQEVQPGSDGLLFHPYLAGERSPYWNPKLRASLTGLSMAHTAGHIYRALLEGTAMSISDAMRALKDLPICDEPIRLTGGGTRNRLWVEILASVLDRSLQITANANSTIGASYLALQALCGSSWLITENRQAPQSLVIHPKKNWVEQYQAHFQRYLDQAAYNVRTQS